MRRDDAIYLLGSDDKLERVPFQPYSSETVLQELIEKHCELLAGEQMDPEDPPRWLAYLWQLGSKIRSAP